jgi:WD40 repeat protein/tRNA A-37 threonylcarbamoyl transferase component Bud32
MAEIIGSKFGRYKILEPLGEGGMAAVYKGYDERLHREVAVKIIKVPQVGENRFLARFEREAEALAQLSHPNIVDIYDYGEERGLPYLVMEHLSGGTLKQRLGKPMHLQDAARVVLPIAKALAYAHSQGIIHRDVKPSNILVRQNGEPVLTDFGIASRMESQHTLTGTGLGIGTPEYMSPEQGLGKKLDGRTDLYSLGVVLYELVTGKKPFEGVTPGEIAIKQNTKTAMRPSQILSDLDDMTDRVVLKALERDPDHRYVDMEAFVEVLEGLIQGQPEERFQNIQLQGIANTIDAEDAQTIDALRAEVDALRSGKQGKKRNKAGLIVVGVVIVGLVVFGVWQFRPAAASVPVVTEAALATETPEKLDTPTLLPSPTVTATFTPTVEPTPEVITIENVDRLEEISTFELEQNSDADNMASFPYSYSMAFSPFSDYLATGDYSGKVTIYDLTSGEIVRSLEGHTDVVSEINYSLDGVLIVTGSYDGTVRLWVAENGRQMGEFHGHNGRVYTVAFSSDGTMLASGGNDATVRIWDVASGKNVETLIDKSSTWGQVTSVEFLPETGKLVNSRMQLWDIGSGSLEQVIQSRGGGASPLAISQDGQFLAACSGYDSVKDRKTAIQVWMIDGVREILSIHDSGFYYTTSMQFSSENDLLFVSGFKEGVVEENGRIVMDSPALQIINVTSGEIVKELSGGSLWAISPDGTLLGNTGEKITVYGIH